MGRFRKKRLNGFLTLIAAVALVPDPAYGSLESAEQEELLGEGAEAFIGGVSAEQMANLASQHQYTAQESGVPDGPDAGTRGPQAAHVLMQTIGSAEGNHAVTERPPAGGKRTGASQSSTQSAAGFSSSAILHQLAKRGWPHGGSSHPVAIYASHLKTRALKAGQEAIDLLSTAEGLSQDRAGLVLKLLRRWPGLRGLHKRYEDFKLPSTDQLLLSLVQYRARATDLATRPRPRMLASRAIRVYVDVGDAVFHNVMAAFLSAVQRLEHARLRDFRAVYLPMLQAVLSASASMLYHVHSRHSRACLKIIERRIVQLETLGRIARKVRQTWENLASAPLTPAEKPSPASGGINNY